MSSHPEDLAPSQGAISQHGKSMQQQIEEKTLRTLRMKSALTDKTLAKCHPQSQSPLYHTLPKEIRDIIFAFATAPFEDRNRPYNESTYFYRPGHTARHRTCTSLLRTCRRIWLETNALPMQQAEHAFWFQRGPYDQHGEVGWNRNVMEEHSRYERLLDRLTTSNNDNLSHVHLFLQMHKFEDLPHRFLSRFFYRNDVRRWRTPLGLDVFQITVRHSDWTNWEQDAPLSLDDALVKFVLDSLDFQDCKQFRLELETLERKKDQLQSIIDRLVLLEGRPWARRTIIENGSHVAYKYQIKGDPQTWHWRGSAHIGDQEHVDGGIEHFNYHVTVLTWHLVKCEWHGDYPLSPLLPTYGIWPAVRTSLFNDQVNLNNTVQRLPPPFRIRPFPAGTPLSRRIRRTRLYGGPHFGEQLFSRDDHGWEAAVQSANRMEDVRRVMFLKALGDLKARELTAEWEAKGSLLEFERISLSV